MSYILALDQGTTSSRALLIDHEGKVKAKAQKEFQQIFPQPGLVEHDPQQIWSTQLAVAVEVLALSRTSPKEVKAIGITNQRETTLVWDKKTGQPLMNAIVWQDRRTTSFCEELKKQGLEPLFRQKTGLLLDPYFSGTKLHWILKNTPGALERAKKGELAFGTVDSWLLWKLTKGAVHATDKTNASRTLLFNIESQCWDEELLQILGIPSSMLPEVRSCSEVYGFTEKDLFSCEIPIAGIAGDQQASLIGQGCLKEGMVKNTYGTGCFLLMNTGQKPVHSSQKLITTIAYAIKGQTTYALEGSVFIAGAVVQWLRDALGMIKNSSDIETLASSVSSSGGIYFVPAFTGLGAPYWDPYARGTLLGITRGSTSAHIARAALESIAYQVADVLKAMQKDAQIRVQELRVDGGAVKNNLLLQFQADLLHVPVIRPDVTELTALGAAYLAGLAIGFWKNQEEILSYWKADKIFQPQKSEEEMNRLYIKWQKAVDVSRAWEEKSL
jgi:glycerol kinase